jgi:hypothetical protein
MTQMDMALATDQTYFTFISAVENGKAKLPTKDIELWAEALQLDSRLLAQAFLQAYDVDLYGVLFKEDALNNLRPNV